jgi:plasmid stability protein
MAMTLRLTDEEHAALRERAEIDGISMQDAARQAVRSYIARGDHDDRVHIAARRVIGAHTEALERLGR